MKVVDEGRMLLNGHGRDHGSSGLNNYPKKAKAGVRGSKISSNTGVFIHRFFFVHYDVHMWGK